MKLLKAMSLISLVIKRSSTRTIILEKEMQKQAMYVLIIFSRGKLIHVTRYYTTS